MARANLVLVSVGLLALILVAHAAEAAPKAVFSRPVIALGSDFGDGASEKLAPFTLSCAVPGKARWVSTTIYRFDPDIEWPTDLDCEVEWNTGLKAWDGAKLSLGKVPATRRLQSMGMSMWQNSVTSERAVELTGDLWSPYSGTEEDKLPEVPPDGKVNLGFSAAVNLQAIADALQLLEGNKERDVPVRGPSLPFTVSPCYTPAPWKGTPALKDINDTCAEVAVGASLKPDTWYTLRLPAGVRYAALSGPTSQAFESTLAGLRPFRIPLENSTDDGALENAIMYRRLDLWLPHGLDPSTSLADLKAAIAVCEVAPGQDAPSPCVKSEAFELSRPVNGKARLSIAGLSPGKKYRLTIAASANVKDGFGQSLLASETEWYMDFVSYEFKGPESGTPSLLEASDPLSSWPFLTVAPPPANRTDIHVADAYKRSVDLFVLDPSRPQDVLNLLSIFKDTYSISAAEKLGPLGAPTATVIPDAALTTAGSGAGWTEVALPLPAFKLAVVSTCCSPRVEYWSGKFVRSEPEIKVLMRSSLSLSMVTSGNTFVAWVNDISEGAAAGPVAGASVTLYGMPESLWDEKLERYVPRPAFLVKTMATDAEGKAVFTMPEGQGGTQLAALAVAGDRVTLLTYAGYGPNYISDQNRLLGKLVLDRLVIQPGDTLKVTGYVQIASSKGLTLPKAGWAYLEVSPTWQPTSTGETSPGRIPGRKPVTTSAPPPRFPVELDGTSGSIHAEIPVPADARYQQYILYLYMLPTGGAPAKPDLSKAYLAGYNYAATESFTVADPRPPTAELLVSADPWVRPTGVITVTATAVSYIGAAVDGSPINIRWAHTNASGFLEVTTDVTGKAVGRIDLGALPEAKRTSAGDSVAITVEWMGPTRELITKTASVRVADGPASISVSRSLQTIIPGIEFGVSSALTSNDNNAPINDIPVTITLRPTPGEAAGAACSTVQSCTVASGKGFADSGCRLALPCVGHFELEACADVAGAAGKTCAKEQLGRNLTEWRDNPLSGVDSIEMALDKPGGYRQGDSPVLIFENPYPSARLLVVWGNDWGTKTHVQLNVPAGVLVEASFGPLGSECLGGCAVSAVLDVPRLSEAQFPLPPAAQLPVSKVFDPRAPRAFTWQGSTKLLPDNALTVDVAVAAAPGSDSWIVSLADGEEATAIEPGSKAQVTVSVTGAAASDGPVEVTVYGVDLAFLDLLPYDLPKPERDIVLNLAASISVYGMDAYRIAPGSVRAVFDKLIMRLKDLDPWLPISTAVMPYSGGDVDTPDDKFLERYASVLSFMPNQWRNTLWEQYRNYRLYTRAPPAHYTPMPGEQEGAPSAPLMPASSRPPPPAKRRAPPRGPGSSPVGDDEAGVDIPKSSEIPDAEVRKAAGFIVTPLFTTKMAGADGKAVVEFTAPPNLGTFKLRAFAAAGAKAKYGSGEGQVVVRRRLSLTPSVPRFVRASDTFEAGAVVTVGSLPATVKVTATVSGSLPLSLTGPATQTLSFPAGGGLQREVRFALAAVGLGNASLTLSAQDTAPGGARDGLEMSIPVYGQQGDVWVATSFALSGIAAGGADSWQEGMVLPDAVPGSGGLRLTAGVGYLPAIQALYDNLNQTEDPDREYPTADRALMWVTEAPVLSYYAQSVDAGSKAYVDAAYRDLARLTHSYYGLVWSDWRRWAGYDIQWCDVGLNLWALHMLKEHATAAKATPASASGWSTLESTQAPTWTQAVNDQLIRDAEEARRIKVKKGQEPVRYSDWYTLAWARLVFGASWTPKGATTNIASDLSLERLLDNVANATKAEGLGQETRVMLSLLLLSMGASNPHPAFVTETVSQLTSSLRVQGRTAYVAAYKGSSSPAPLQSQSLALLLMVRTGVTSQLLPRLAAHVANPVQTPSRGGWAFWVWDSWQTQAYKILALEVYDRSRGSAKPNIDLTADANGLTVLTAGFHTGGNIDPVTRTTPWEALPPAPAGQAASELNFQAVGSGEVTVAASLHFVPSAPLTFPTYRGIYVESVMQVVDPATGVASGPRVGSVPLASLVLITIQLTTPDDLGAVTLSVMMPGGLEPLDPNLVADAGWNCENRWVDDWMWGRFFSWWWWPVCPSRETKPHLVTFSYAALRSGTSSVSIKAVAATAGSFVVPPVRAWVEQQPELMGMTPSAALTVCADCAAAAPAPAPPKPKACPRACGGSGVCNVNTGVCVCDPGFGGRSCTTAA
ncbi:hypothetical protein HYH03_011597 [Edaphochlamys debaryana]|uniref:EGF-like domain-containing protein n=1 Tax=Edaphochlamys debaryana TaxID=47281 RepID=A0A835XVS5_9CHLO|nr:hypothetical protein HYH03_011597 [Edaphochlamys debaryana]|eukprot:KAG2489968.1 hypothetical protein HYH03_011597 [Edaphochlamys debaryana]